MKKIFIVLIILVVLIAILLAWFFIINNSENNEKPIVCAMDVKICSDGSYVSRFGPDCEFAPCPKEDLIQIENLQVNQVINSPLFIEGKARGYWFFEANFPIKLFDAEGKLLGIAIAQAQNENGVGWMTEDFVPFKANLEFELPKTEMGILVFEKDNPSGLLENADELRMPVSFLTESRKVNLYYYNPELDKDSFDNIQCSQNGLVAVSRQIPISQTPIQDTIKLLLLGNLTQEEKSQGIETEYPLDGFSLKSASLNNEVLTLEFNDSLNKTIGGSCRTGILWFQIEATAKQFPEVQEVRFLPEDIFQP
ncbi:GerMN domain-containing protein [Candidatus Wolfebacteria bacterium]|nr:GerMN domain-containing protein [Candidatus Wolfebacteria bacterium]